MTWKHITQAAGPGQPERYQAIVAHLQRDHDERRRLTLKGADLGYYCAFAQPGDPLRAWVLARIDERINDAELARHSGGSDAQRHVCMSCYGHGCDACRDVGLVCPTCRGSRWRTDGKPTSNRVALVACPDCTTPTPTGRAYDPLAEGWAIQRYIDGLARPSGTND